MQLVWLSGASNHLERLGGSRARGRFGPLLRYCFESLSDDAGAAVSVLTAGLRRREMPERLGLADGVAETKPAIPCAFEKIEDEDARSSFASGTAS